MAEPELQRLFHKSSPTDEHQLTTDDAQHLLHTIISVGLHGLVELRQPDNGAAIIA